MIQDQDQDQDRAHLLVPPQNLPIQIHILDQDLDDHI